MAGRRSFGDKVNDNLKSDFVAALQRSAPDTLEEVEELLRLGVDPNLGINLTSPTVFPLHCVIANPTRNSDATLKLVNLLLQFGADPCRRPQAGTSTALEVAACKKGNYEITAAILNYPGIQFPPELLRKIFLFCVHRDSSPKDKVKIIQALMEKGVSIQSDPKAKIFPLHEAVWDWRLLIVFLEAGVDPMSRDDRNITVIEAAIGADTNYLPKWQIVNEILTRAGEKITPAILEKVFMLCMKDAPKSPIKTAIIKRFLELDVSVTARFGEDANAPLHFIALDGDAKATLAFLERGADATSANKQGETPFELAAMRGNWQVVATYLEHRSSAFDADTLGKVLALVLAVESSESNQLAETILALRPNPNVWVMQKGICFYPLHQAARRKDEALILTLLDMNADLNKKQLPADKTVLEILAEQNAWDIISKLLAIAAERKIELKYPDNLGKVLWHAIRSAPAEEAPVAAPAAAVAAPVPAAPAALVAAQAMQIAIVAPAAPAPSSVSVIEPLLRAGANPNVICSYAIGSLHPDNIKHCPTLFVAILRANRNIIRQLLLLNANPEFTNLELDAHKYATRLGGLSRSAYRQEARLITDLHTARSAYMRVLGRSSEFLALPNEILAIILFFAHGQTYQEFASPEEKKELATASSPADLEDKQIKLVSSRIPPMRERIAELKLSFEMQRAEIAKRKEAEHLRQVEIARRQAEQLKEKQKLEAVTKKLAEAHAKLQAEETERERHQKEARHSKGKQLFAEQLREQRKEASTKWHRAIMSAFRYIYAALMAAQGKELSLPASIRSHTPAQLLSYLCSEKSQPQMDENIAAAFHLAKIHKNACNQDNILLVWSIYKQTFKQSGLFKVSNVFGTMYFSSDSLEKNAGDLTEEQATHLREKIANLDLEHDTDRLACIVRTIPKF